ncbi:NACHT domain-containing protein [Pseudomonas sp. P105]|uniref:NACHT domain-containing protein n=1 Tax=Pseudomonas sp. P105 TaxID=3049542 RepID=UPI0029343FC7|nr:NACHT domain-containing protein [Pseudomonas sp. P105]WNZ80323.1 NACHT domain-containing protein [Pseudomonas sp. P105]
MLEISLPILVKTVSPIIKTLTLECASIIKDHNLKWDATNSIKKLSKILLNINTVKTMWSRDKGVLISDFYYPSRISRGHSEIGSDPSKLVFTNTVLEGIVGQGKSIFMRQLCNYAVESSLIPVFIELRMISQERTLMSLIIDYLDAAGIQGGNHIFHYLADKSKIVLILDGFDEIPTNSINTTVYHISHLQKVHDNLKIIVSSRPAQAIQNLAGFETQTLAPLDESDYEKFLRKLIPDPITLFNIQAAILEAPPNIKGVITTPLMLTLLVQVYHVETEIPASLPDFYDKLFNAVFIKHDGIKPGFERERYSGLPPTKLQKLFDAFCFMALQSGVGRTLTNKEFNAAFNKAIKYTPTAICEPDGFKKDIITVACLMLNDGFEQTSFLHKSIMEYHAASFIQNSNDGFAKTFYQKAPENLHNWSETLTFLSYIDEFRYGNAYILHEYPPALARLTSALEQRTPEALIEYLNSEIPDFTIHLEGNTPTLFATGGSSRQHSFSNAILGAVIANVQYEFESASTKNIQNAIRETPKTRGAIGINIKAMVKYFGHQLLWERLSLIESDLIEKINKYQTIVDDEMKKHEIFG